MAIAEVPGEHYQKTVNRLLRQMFGEKVNYRQLKAFRDVYGVLPTWIRKDSSYALPRAFYRVPTEDEPLSRFGYQPVPETAEVAAEVAEPVQTVAAAEPQHPALTESEMSDKLNKLADEASQMSVVPDVLDSFVPFGDYQMVEDIIASKNFFPVFTSGLSGNGKTLFPEQACAKLGREFINIDITQETDEDDLIGGFRLRNGSTYFELGPASVAMLRGSILVLNELDLGSPKIMCLQRVLEGKPLTIKKLGVVIKPKHGFNVFATANTKGRGDEDGRFIGTGMLNEAFLERFPVTVEQEYPDVETEKLILTKTYQSVGGVLKATPVEFCKTLAKWADMIRKSYQAGAVEDLISTRRLCHIVKAYKIFGDQDMALTMCLQRFDPKVRSAFVDFYNKVCPAKAGQPSNVGDMSGGKKPPF